jgi:hypothetical protein
LDAIENAEIASPKRTGRTPLRATMRNSMFDVTAYRYEKE